MQAVILCTSREPRNPRLISQVEQSGALPIVFEGLNGATMSKSQLRDIYSEERAVFLLGRPLSSGEVAAAWGHREIIRRSLHSSENWTVVLEDDVEVTASLNEALGQLGQLPPGPNVVLLFDCSQSWVAKRWYRDSEPGLFQLAEAPWRALGYAINANAAQLVADITEDEPIDYWADWPYTWSHRVNFWASTIPSVSQRSSDSIIENSRWIYNQAAPDLSRHRRSSFVLSILGVRLLRARLLGISPACVWRRDVVMPLSRRAKLLTGWRKYLVETG